MWNNDFRTSYAGLHDMVHLMDLTALFIKFRWLVCSHGLFSVAYRAIHVLSVRAYRFNPSFQNGTMSLCICTIVLLDFVVTIFLSTTRATRPNVVTNMFVQPSQ